MSLWPPATSTAMASPTLSSHPPPHISVSHGVHHHARRLLRQRYAQSATHLHRHRQRRQPNRNRNLPHRHHTARNRNHHQRHSPPLHLIHCYQHLLGRSELRR